MRVIKEIEDKIIRRLGEENVLRDEPMHKHLTMRVGGPAAYFLTPENEDDLAFVISILREADVPYYILGRGSNVIVKDEGYSGVIVNISGKMSDISVEGEKIIAQAGAKLRDIALASAASSLSGFEFAAGIPGALGGAVTMNAGAYGGEMKDVVESVRVIMPDGSICEIPGDDMKFSYRSSLAAEEDMVILSAALRLNPGKENKIREKMADLSTQRTAKQPLDYPSCGSTFKRPSGYFAGKLIMDSGLKGYKIGGAEVSEKHCGFIINRNHACAADVISLINYVKETVYEKQGVKLECEVKIL